ncbi:MAG: hypothetical protein ABI304_12640 [Rudaea sp.]
MYRLIAAFAVTALLSANLAAQDLPVYTDTLQNGFSDWSYGGGSNFTDTTHFHSGAASISFTGSAGADNGVSLEHGLGGNPSPFAPGTYSGLRLFVNGGATGGQKLSLSLEVNGGTPVLASAVTLPAAPANAWLQIDVALSDLAFTNDGSFDRIDLLPTVNSQAQMFIDDVTLIGASSSGGSGNYLFGSSFEPEYMFVPQYNLATSGSIKVYLRTTNTANFTFVREAPLGAGTHPNAVSFAPDGGLWVVDDGSASLRRYSLQSMLADANPAPTVSVGPVGDGSSIFDLAFFGAYGYVSQSNFGSANQILKFTLANLNAGANVSTSLTNAALHVPTGLTFDAQGHLWIANDNNGSPGTLVRMSAPSVNAAIDVTISNAAGGHAINGAEGLGFDEFGTLWVGDNAEPTLYGFAAQQLTATGNPTPIGQIDMPTPAPNHAFTGYVGGIAFDRRGDVRINYEYDYTVRAFTATAGPWSGPSYTSYTSAELTALSDATADPGRGGIAIWPVPHTVHR